MRRTMLVLGIIGVLLSFAASAAPLSICSYVSPETSLESLGLAMSYRYFDDWATPGVDSSGGRADLDYNRLYDSPGFGYTLTGNVGLLLADFFPTSAQADGAGTVRYFLMDDSPTFGFGSVEASVSTGQLQPAVYVSAGMGYGRFNDVTPLAKAFKIDMDLRRIGAISSALEDDVLMEIASVIGSKEYTSINDQVADAVDQIQMASGVTLSPRQVLKVEDMILAIDDSRYCGWSVQAGAGYQLIDPFNQSQGFLITASADAAFVPNPDGQLLFHAGLSGPINFTDQNTIKIRGSYDYSLSETSSLRATYALSRVQPLGQPASTSQTLSALLGFTLGHADMGLQASLSKSASALAWSLDLSISAALSFDW